MSLAGHSLTLQNGARELGVELGDAPTQRLLSLLDELLKWNAAYNLTAITDPVKMLTHHLLDSLSVQPMLHGTTVADVGTGAGFPGLPLAVVNPDRRFTLIDSNNKKVRFVGHAAHLLGLKNVTAVHSRSESFKAGKPFDTVIARAFAALPELLKLVAPLCGPETRVLAMKGKRPDDEIAGVPASWRVLEVRALAVPGLSEERHLVSLQRAAASAD
ncbi:MAG TPA: 16S rRNA (guanine(527)-N(7))-methyltransferase RsmG [Steroidobacteraceae bacterium]|nr:16S rRNA (guanine(527)-N(7))-methyltransferase RsmG [Steroidobacteraceae bacterium]